MKYAQWTATAKNIGHLVRKRLFPARCRLCSGAGQAGLELCPGCWQELPWLRRGCRHCALPLPAGSNPDICASCLRRPPVLDACSALFIYRPPVDQWIHALKFRQQLSSGHLLGRLLADNMPDIRNSQPVTVVPVPLHRQRLAERGYNQSLEIAAILRRRDYRLDPACCRRARPTAAQSDLPANNRRRNIRGAFTTTRGLEGERILLIDDVMTTGATLNELARTLKQAGAAHVEARVIARTIPRN